MSIPSEAVGQDADASPAESQGKSRKVDLGKANVAAARLGGWLKSQAAKASETLDSHVKEMKDNTKLIVSDIKDTIVSDITDTVQKGLGDVKHVEVKHAAPEFEGQFDVMFVEKTGLGLELNIKRGAIVKRIVEGGQAHRLKVQVHDRLVAIEGERLPPLPPSGRGDDAFVAAVKRRTSKLPRPVSLTFVRTSAANRAAASVFEIDDNFEDSDSDTNLETTETPAPLAAPELSPSPAAERSYVSCGDALSIQADAEASCTQIEHADQDAISGALRKRCEELETSRDDAAQNALAQKELANTGAHTTSNRLELAEARAQVSVLRQELDTIVRESDQKTRHADALQNEIDRIRAERDLQVNAEVQEIQRIMIHYKASEEELKTELETAERRTTAVEDALRVSEASAEQLGHKVAQSKLEEDDAARALAHAEQLRLTELGTVEAQLQEMQARMESAEETCAAEMRVAQRFKAMKEDAAKVARAAVERAERLEMSRPEVVVRSEPAVTIEPSPESTQASPESLEALTPMCLGKPGDATDQEPPAEDLVAATDDEDEVYGRLLGGASGQPKASGANKAVGYTSSGVAFIRSGDIATTPEQRLAQLEAQNLELRKLLTDSDEDLQQDGDVEATLSNNHPPSCADATCARAKQVQRAASAGCRRKLCLRQTNKALRFFTRLLLKNPFLLWIFYGHLLLIWSAMLLRQT